MRRYLEISRTEATQKACEGEDTKLRWMGVGYYRTTWMNERHVMLPTWVDFLDKLRSGWVPEPPSRLLADPVSVPSVAWRL